MKKNHRLDHLSLRAAELENYEAVVSDLDQQLEEVQQQLTELKTRKQNGASPMLNRSNPRQLRQESVKQEGLKAQEALARKFIGSRAAIASALSKPENIAQLFANQQTTSFDHHEDSTTHESDARVRTFSAPIQNTLMLLSQQLITTCLVELNLRYAFYDPQLKKVAPDNTGFYRPNLFKTMHEDDEKNIMLRELSTLRSDVVSNSKPYLQQLDPAELRSLYKGIRQSDLFSSMKLLRYDMYINKSGRWRNYEHSDTTSAILAIKGPIFQSCIVSNDDYFTTFDKLFSLYRSSFQPLKHLRFVLHLARVITGESQSIPTNAILRDLLDRFGSAGLYNYQSVVYHHLPPFQCRETAWADSEYAEGFASKDLLHFVGLIKEDPKLLRSLIEYNRVRGNDSFVKSLVLFLEPLSTTTRLNVLFPLFIKKTSSANLDRELSDTPILFERNVIDSAIRACVDFKDYKSVDKLIGTLIINLVKTAEGIRVFSGPESAFKELRHSRENNIKELLSEDLLQTLGEAFCSIHDQQRCEWIAPFIKDRIEGKENSQLKPVYDLVMQVLQASPKAVPQETQDRKFRRTSISTAFSGTGSMEKQTSHDIPAALA
ncbi:hypothetical protein HF325_004844 [Metschnikowia pulcherrima]|uniref:Uncharacterized protein n=1 Tax=Metschnikowia pulcherrima TaxID=27326 RepID=A0A8H7GP18_9ASCO|nr:hypothetical protein HF325_004844 [Metschnikowia pulcherrima]